MTTAQMTVEDAKLPQSASVSQQIRNLKKDQALLIEPASPLSIRAVVSRIRKQLPKRAFKTAKTDTGVRVYRTK